MIDQYALPESKHLLTDQKLLYFFTHSKQLVLSSSNQRLVVEQDIQRWQRLVFIELIVFLCFVADCTFSQTLVHGFPITFAERLKLYLQLILPKFNLEFVDTELTDEHEKLVGLDKIE